MTAKKGYGHSYKADLKIDKKNIDDEILRQPQLYYEWAQLEAEAKINEETAKRDYDIVLADVEEKVRANPEKYFEHNVTEGAIKNAVVTNRKVRRYRKKWDEARRHHKLIEKAEKAFEQRKRMIESYLYHIHKRMSSDVRVPRKVEERFNRDTRRRIQNQIEPGLRRRK